MAWPRGHVITRALNFPEIFWKFPEILAKVWEVMTSTFSSEFADILGTVIKSSYFSLNIMHKVTA